MKPQLRQHDVEAVKVAMAAVYTEVSLEDMDKLLKRAFYDMRPKRGSFSGSYYYDLKAGDNVAIRVWTSVSVSTGVSRGKQKSPMKVLLVSLKRNGFPLEKATVVKRTQKWRTTLQDLIEEKIEMYESKTDYWEHRALEPNDKTEYEKAKDEDGEGDEDDEDLSKDDESLDPHGTARMLEEIASWAKLSDGKTWGVAVKDPHAKEGDKVRARTQGGDESTITLGKLDSERYGKRLFYKTYQEGGRPQRSYGYDRRY